MIVYAAGMVVVALIFLYGVVRLIGAGLALIVAVLSAIMDREG